MKSPFPGMDPFIESSGLWEDFHNHLVEKIGATLADLAPDHYLVRTGERSFILIQEEHRESFVEIFEASPGQRLVTSIEVLSPSNKRRGTEGWQIYQRKRQGLLLADVNFVEIDLLRGGERMPMLDPWPDSHIYVRLFGRRILTAADEQQALAVRRPSGRRPIA